MPVPAVRPVVPRPPLAHSASSLLPAAGRSWAKTVADMHSSRTAVTLFIVAPQLNLAFRSQHSPFSRTTLVLGAGAWHLAINLVPGRENVEKPSANSPFSRDES